METLWEENFALLCEFKNTHGHCNVPRHYPENPALGMWASIQREFYKNNKLSQNRINKLDTIGFIWSAFETLWEKNFAALCQFKNIHGHCNVPLRYPKNPALGQWVIDQRQVCKKGKLSPDRTEKLNGIGFIWDIKKAQ